MSPGIYNKSIVIFAYKISSKTYFEKNIGDGHVHVHVCCMGRYGLPTLSLDISKAWLATASFQLGSRDWVKTLLG